MRQTLVTLSAIALLALCTPAAARAEPDNPQAEAARARAAERRAEIDQGLDGLASEMARALSHPGFRGLVRAQIAQSKKREQLLELEDFLGKAKGEHVPPGLEKLLQSTRETRGRLKASAAVARSEQTKASERAAQSGGAQSESSGPEEEPLAGGEAAAPAEEAPAADGLDLYFPVPEHRKKWKGNTDLLVAFSPMDDEADVSEIVAYSVKTGRKVTLDPKKAPEQPVLVIAAEEHESHDVPEAPAPSDPPADVRGEPDLVDTNPSDPGTNTRSLGQGYRFGMGYLRIFTESEPWYAGAPEIYILSANANTGTGPTHRCNVQKYDCPSLDQVNSWYYTLSAGTCEGDLGFNFNTLYGDSKVVFGVWERDGGSAIRVYDQILPDSTCVWGPWSDGPYSGDDQLALIWNFTNLLQLGGYYRQRMTNVEAIWQKLPR